MADEDWAAEVDEQERQITGQVSESRITNISYLDARVKVLNFFGDLQFYCFLSSLKMALGVVVQMQNFWSSSNGVLIKYINKRKAKANSRLIRLAFLSTSTSETGRI